MARLQISLLLSLLVFVEPCLASNWGPNPDDYLDFLGTKSTGKFGSDFGGGQATTSMGTGSTAGRGVILQTDGKAVVIGRTDVNTFGGDFALARYYQDGGIDITYGTNGTMTTSFGTGDDLAYGAILQTDGKVVVAGKSDRGFAGYYEFAIVRFNTDGSIDTSFNTTGKNTNTVNPVTLGRGIAMSSTGNIAVVGYTWNSGSFYQPAIARYSTAGMLDTSFGANKVRMDSIGSTDTAYLGAAYGVLSGDTASVYAVGVQSNSNNDVLISKYNASGVLDTSFATKGHISWDSGNGADAAYGVALQPTGEVVIAGASNTGTKLGMLVQRWTTNGTLDTTFNNNGTLTVNVGTSSDFAYAIALQTDGHIVVGGSSTLPSTKNQFAMLRVNTNGTLDTSFYTNGIVTTQVNTDAAAQGIAILNDSMIVLGGRTVVAGVNVFAIVRYNADGSIASSGDVDHGFGMLNLRNNNPLFASLPDFAIRRYDLPKILK